MIMVWKQLNERDRGALVLGIMVLAVYFLYLMVYSPITTRVKDKTQRLVENKATLAWLLQAQKKQTGADKIKTMTSGQILSVLSREIKSSAIKSFPYQLQKLRNNDIELAFKEVPFNAAVNWLKMLSTRYAFSLKQLKVDKTDTPGIVKMTAVISID